MFKSTALTVLRTFRQQLHASLGLRQDSLFELLDSALSSPDRRTLVRLSLNPAFPAAGPVRVMPWPMAGWTRVPYGGCSCKPSRQHQIARCG